jgi:hypothetical protein
VRLAALLPFAACALGCDAALGIEALPRGDQIAWAAPACGQCVADGCQAAADACAKNRLCRPLADCVARCAPSDPKCRAVCESASPLGATDPQFLALDRCVRASCTETCYGVGGLGKLFAPGDACKCLDDACVKEELACVRSGIAPAESVAGACERRAACFAAGPVVDPEAADSCGAAFPEGSAAARALKECWSNTTCKGCPVAGTGIYECVGRYRWLAPTKPTLKMSFKITTFDAAQKPIVGATVRACGADKCARCDAGDEIAKGTSDAGGLAALTLPAGLTGFAGCFDFEAPGFARQGVSLGRPITRDSVETPMFLIASETLPLLGAVAGSPLLADHGLVVAFAVDCFVNFAAGVSMSVDATDPAMRLGYFVNNTFDLKATETGRLGVGVFINVPATGMTLTMRHGGKVVTRQPILPRPGVVTAVLGLPSVAD